MSDAIPTYTPKAKAAWRRLQAHKPFMLRTLAGNYFVDSGGYATLVQEDGKASGASVKAFTLLDQDKREPTTKRGGGKR